MGGKLDCVSAPGVGSTFWFEVVLPDNNGKVAGLDAFGKVPVDTSPFTGSVSGPAAAPVAATPPVADIEAGQTTAAAEIPRLKILLADDHAANRKVVEILLSTIRAELVAVCNGREAVEAYEAGSFDLVLMDMQMPEMDGLSATRAIRALEEREGRRRTPVVMLTANAMAEHVAAGRKAGADQHLCKPVTLDDLLEAIEVATSSQADVQD